MNQWKLRQFVGLHEREGRAWHFDRGIAGEIANERAGERCLARAEIARERNQIAGLERVGDVDRKPLGGVLVRQRYREARRAGT